MARGQVAAALRLAFACATMHLGYGVGSLIGLWRRAPATNRRAMSDVYRRYRNDPGKRKQWNVSDPGQAALLSERDQALAAVLRERFGEQLAGARVLDLGAGGRDLGAALAEQGVKPAIVVSSAWWR